MKQKRHGRILELISDNEIWTQEELLERLRSCGFDVTQATVSRDIKELRLVKSLSGSGKYIYSPSTSKAGSNDLSSKFNNLFSESVVRIDYVFNQIVIKCYSGLANALCAAMDSMQLENTVGSIAGDDTILIIMRSEESAAELYNLLVKKL